MHNTHWCTIHIFLAILVVAIVHLIWYMSVLLHRCKGWVFQHAVHYQWGGGRGAGSCDGAVFTGLDCGACLWQFHCLSKCWRNSYRYACACGRSKEYNVLTQKLGVYIRNLLPPWFYFFPLLHLSWASWPGTHNACSIHNLQCTYSVPRNKVNSP